MAFPSLLTSFSYPTPSSKLNSPSHSGLENQQSSAIGQLETFIGPAGDSSVAGTLLYDVRSAASGGGGHVQTAVLGGTGQVIFTKGDILVAQSASVISKLSLGGIGQVLSVNPGSPVGLSWSSVVSNKIIATTTSVVHAVDTNTFTIWAGSILGSTLGTNNVVRFTGRIPVFAANTDITFIANYGNNVATSVVAFMPAAITSVRGEVTGMIVGNGDVSQQISHISFLGTQLRTGTPLGSILYATSTHPTTSSVNSSADQDFVIQAKFGATNNLNSILTATFLLEKLQ